MTTARTKYNRRSSRGWLMMIVGHETKVKVKVSIYFCLDDDDHWTVAQAATAQQRSSTLANIFIGSSSSRGHRQRNQQKHPSIHPPTHSPAATDDDDDDYNCTLPLTHSLTERSLYLLSVCITEQFPHLIYKRGCGGSACSSSCRRRRSLEHNRSQIDC